MPQAFQSTLEGLASGIREANHRSRGGHQAVLVSLLIIEQSSCAVHTPASTILVRVISLERDLLIELALSSRAYLIARLLLRRAGRPTTLSGRLRCFAEVVLGSRYPPTRTYDQKKTTKVSHVVHVALLALSDITWYQHDLKPGALRALRSTAAAKQADFSCHSSLLPSSKTVSDSCARDSCMSGPSAP